MRTATALINIENVTVKEHVYTVEYWDENCEGENNATIQINQESLLDFIESEGMNVGYYKGESFTLPADDYLGEYMHEVIKDYISANS